MRPQLVEINKRIIREIETSEVNHITTLSHQRLSVIRNSLNGKYSSKLGLVNPKCLHANFDGSFDLCCYVCGCVFDEGDKVVSHASTYRQYFCIMCFLRSHVESTAPVFQIKRNNRLNPACIKVDSDGHVTFYCVKCGKQLTANEETVRKHAGSPRTRLYCKRCFDGLRL